MRYYYLLCFLCSYVRIRRKQQTFYVLCEPTVHGADHLKSQVRLALQDDAPESLDEMRLMDTGGTELDEDLSKLENEQELHIVFRISDDEYEPVDVRNVDMSEW